MNQNNVTVNNTDEITPEILICNGWEYKNAASMLGSKMMVFTKCNLMLRFRSNGLYRINPENRMENIGAQITTVEQLNSLVE